jgi:hypothetical protein
MESTAESFGLPATCDFMIAVTTNDQLDDLGQFNVKQLKNRYGDKSKQRRFMIGVDKGKQRLFDVRQEIAEGAANEPKKTKTTFGKFGQTTEKGFDGIHV